jgi:hypothetical protein
MYVIKKGTIIFHPTTWDIRKAVFDYGDFEYNKQYGVPFFYLDDLIAERIAFYIADVDTYLMPIVVRARVRQDVKLFHYERNEFRMFGQAYYYRELMKELDITDPKFLYRFIDQRRYEGAIMMDEFEGITFETIALFETLFLETKRYKCYSRIGSAWSKYLSIDDVVNIYYEANERYRQKKAATKIL